MAARYLQIAQELRRRLRDGTWVVGDRFPTLRQLQENYPDVGASTLQAAVKVLVDEGHLEARRGVGSFVASLPPEDDGLSETLEQLQLVQSAATRALRALEHHVIRPVRVEVMHPENPVTEGWGYMQSAYCRTCDEDLGGVTRGWVATEDYYDSHVSWGGHDELEHDIVVTYGATSPGEDQDQALLRELWWERYARLKRAAEELLAGNQQAAHQQAQEAVRISAENPTVNQLSITLGSAP